MQTKKNKQQSIINPVIMLHKVHMIQTFEMFIPTVCEDPSIGNM